jgi:hypothetical protein
MIKHLVLGIVAGSAATLIAEKLIKMRRDMVIENNMYPRKAYRHFCKLEQHGRDNFAIEKIIKAGKS